MPSLSKSFRLFKEGLDRKLLWKYWIEFKEKAWEVFWGPTLLGVAFGIYTLWHSPALPWFQLYVLAVVFLTGYYLWRVNHLRLEQKLSITKIFTQPWTDERGDCIAYYFEILNESEGVTVHKINAQFYAIEPTVQNLGWLPVLLWQKHDNPIPGVAHVPLREFDLNPRGIKHIDFVSSWRGRNHFTVHQIAVPNIYVPIAQGFKYRLQVVVTAQDMPQISQWFEVWMDDEDMLQCKMEPTTEEPSQKL
jgi:hypothetical protein